MDYDASLCHLYSQVSFFTNCHGLIKIHVRKPTFRSPLHVTFCPGFLRTAIVQNHQLNVWVSLSAKLLYCLHKKRSSLFMRWHNRGHNRQRLLCNHGSTMMKPLHALQ